MSNKLFSFIFFVVGLFLIVTTAKADLVAHYTFDANDANDSSGYNNHGTLYGGASIISDSGGDGKGPSLVLNLDGVNDYVATAAGVDATATNGMTWSIWFKYEGTFATGPFVLDQRESNVGYQPIFIGIGTNAGDLQFYSSNTGNSNYFDTNLLSGKWYHVAMVLGGNTVSCYVNGSFVGSKSDTQYNFGTKRLYIGARHSIASFFKGKIDDVRIYNRALTLSEITHLSNPGATYNPNPQDNATNVSINPTLTWSPGDYVQSVQGHLVYIGTSLSDVNDANTSSSLYKGAYDGNSYSPDTLLQNTIYYWRVDEVNNVNTWKGKVWKFTTQTGPALVGWWKFEGDANDSSNYQNHGTLYNASSIVPDNGGGLKMSSQVLQVNSDSNDYANCGNATSLNITGPITIAAWVKPGIEPNYNNYVVAKLDYGLNQRAWALLRSKASNKWFFAISPDGQPVDVDNHHGAESDSPVAADQWVHLAAVFDGSVQTLYVNGVLQSKTYNVSGIYSCAAPVTIGTNWNNGNPGTNYFNGKIDDIRIYNYALSGAQIAQIVTQGAYSLTTSAGPGGTVTTPGTGTFLYNPGTDANIVATPNAHYHFVNWTGTGVDAGKVAYPNLASTTITMDSNYTAIANFAIDQYTITASAGNNGGIVPSGMMVVNYGESQDFNAVPDTGYEVDKWSVDGNETQVGGNTYTLSNIMANHTVAVTFKVPTNTVTVTASAGANGGIAPSGMVVVNYGESQDFNAVPDTGYEVDKWSVDGNETQVGGNTYTLSNIIANHTVAVTFKTLTGMVAHYTFDANDASDTSGYGNNGSLINGAYVVPDGGGELKRTSLVLNVDGVNDYVNCGSNSILNITGPITIAAWVKPGIEPNSNNYIVSKFDYGSNQRAWALLRHNKANTWFFVISPNGQVVDIDYQHSGAESDSQVITDQWVHLTAVFDGSVQTLYVNGVLQSKTYNVSGIYSSTAPVTIGTNWNNGSPGTNYFNGKIDDVRIYNYALTAEQIAQIMRTDTGCAWGPSPVYGAKNVEPNAILSWSPGDYVQDVNGHDVYLGTDFNDVSDANIFSSCYKGTPDSNSYNPGGLNYDTTYYWRVDEVNGVNSWKGNIWTFKTEVAPIICPQGDLNGDCKVGYDDLSIFCEQWLNSSCPREGLVGHWKFDGDANDSSGNGKNAAIYGNPSWVAGIIDGALKFDGAGDYVVAAGIDANGAGGMSWSAWFNYDANGTFVLDQRENGIGYQPIYIGKDVHIGDLQFYSTDTADANYFDTNLLPGKWYHVAMVLDGNTVSCYVNGSFAGSKPDTNYNFGTKDLHIGARYIDDGSGYFKGAIDDVRIYQRALSEEEIYALAHSGPDCADLDGADGVNFIDFALLAKDWNPTQAPGTETISFVGSPSEIGQKWGQLNADIINSDMQQYFLDPAAAAGLSQQDLIERNQEFVQICQSLAPHWLDEFRAVANAAGVDPNLYTAYVGGVYRNLFLHECISYSVSSDYTLNNAIFFHKNRQNAPKAQAACIIALDVPGVNKFITITDVSVPSCMMMVNDKGLAGSADYPSAGSSGLRYRGMMNTFILRYIAEKAADCNEALTIIQLFVDEGYYAGGEVGGTHWLFVDKTGNILEVENDTVAVTATYHNSDKVYFSLYADSSAANTLRNAAQPIDFHMFHNVSRDPSIVDSISGLTVEISRTNPAYLTTAWITFPAKGLAFPLFMGGKETPVPLVNGEVDTIFKNSNGTTSEWEAIENGLYSESDTVKSQVTTLIDQGRQQDAITFIDNWVKQKAKSGMDEGTGQ